MRVSSIGRRLAEYMRINSWKQIDILEAARPYCEEYGVKMNRSDISQYLHDLVAPGYAKLQVLCKALNVNEQWLRGYDVPLDSTYSRALTTGERVVINEKTKACVFQSLLELAGFSEALDEDANVTIYKENVAVNETPELIERLMTETIDYFTYLLEREGKR